MARWEKIEPISKRIPKGDYMGWSRRHTNIHLYKNEPAGKTSLVQVSRHGDKYTVLAQTTAHGVFTQPPGTKGTMLFKQVSTFDDRATAMAAVAKLKKQLALRFDKITKHTSRGLKRL
jgi:hypothetical protein